MNQRRNLNYVEDLSDRESAASAVAPNPRDRVSGTAPNAPWELGSIVARRFVLEQSLRRGRHGAVYAAVDLVSSRAHPNDVSHVTLHELHPRVTARPSQALEFTKLSAHPQSWSHPNLPKMLDCGRDGSKHYLISELLEGASLRQVLDDPAPEGLSRAEVFAVLRGVGDGLMYAHAKGFFHGELRAQDVLVTTDYVVKVLDLLPLRTSRSVDYFPEDVDGPRTLDARDDVFGVACLAYELLAGRHPFNGNSALEALSTGMVPVPIHGLGPMGWEALSRGLALRRERRTTTVAELLAALGVQGTETLRPPLPPTRTEPRPEIAAPPATQPTELWTPPPPTTRHPTQRRRSVTRPLLGALLVAALCGVVYKDYSLLRSGTSDVIERVVVAARERSAIILGVVDTMLPNRGDAPQAKPAATVADIAAPAVVANPPREIEPPVPAAETAAPVAAPSPSIEPPPVITPQETALVAVRPELEVATASVTVGENVPNARIVVRRNGSLAADASIVWWTSDDTATADNDYADLGARIEKFAAGEDSLALLIPLVADSHPEQPERFFVNLTPSGARAAPATPEIRVEVVVLDDDI